MTDASKQELGLEAHGSGSANGGKCGSSGRLTVFMHVRRPYLLITAAFSAWRGVVAASWRCARGAAAVSALAARGARRKAFGGWLRLAAFRALARGLEGWEAEAGELLKCVHKTWGPRRRGHQAVAFSSTKQDSIKVGDKQDTIKVAHPESALGAAFASAAGVESSSHGCIGSGGGGSCVWWAVPEPKLLLSEGPVAVALRREVRHARTEAESALAEAALAGSAMAQDVKRLRASLQALQVWNRNQLLSWYLQAAHHMRSVERSRKGVFVCFSASGLARRGPFFLTLAFVD